MTGADKVLKKIKKKSKKKDKSWNDEKWIEAMALADLASNYSTIYDVWCKDMINHKMNRKKQKTKD